MARPKSFDVDDVLEQAVDLFWRQGYEATSIRDLESHLGVGRQSLYDTFGDKHALFLKALERYALNQASHQDALRRSDAGLAQIEDWFNSIVLFATPSGPRPACFIVNTVAELGGVDEAASSMCRQHREGLARHFSRALRNAVASGEIPEPSHVAAAADFLVAQTYGLVLLAKNGASRARLQAVARQAMRAIL